MAGICTSPYPSPYPIEKVGDSPYPYSYPVNAGIPCQNGDEFGQYPRRRVYLPSLIIIKIKIIRRRWKLIKLNNKTKYIHNYGYYNNYQILKVES